MERFSWFPSQGTVSSQMQQLASRASSISGLECKCKQLDVVTKQQQHQLKHFEVRTLRRMRVRTHSGSAQSWDPCLFCKSKSQASYARRLLMTPGLSLCPLSADTDTGQNLQIFMTFAHRDCICTLKRSSASERNTGGYSGTLASLV